MGNSESQPKKVPSKPAQVDSESFSSYSCGSSCHDDDQSKDQINPLKIAFSKKILENTITASSNRLIMSHYAISCAKLSQKQQIAGKQALSTHQIGPLQNKQNNIINPQPTNQVKLKLPQKQSIIIPIELKAEISQPEPLAVEILNPKFPSITLSPLKIVRMRRGLVGEKYQFLQRLGQGGFGTVYLGKCKATGQYRAIKQLKVNKSGSGCRKQIQQEIRLLVQMDHPRIVKVYDIMKSEDYYYIIMQYCKGISLQKHIASLNQQRRQEQIKKVMLSLLSVMSYMHARRIIHRDIKPENIVFHKNQKQGNSTLSLKIIDFGLSTQTSLVRGQQQHRIIGTLAYLAPQSFNGKYSSMSDMWSCGMLMLTLMLGRNPLMTETPKKICDIHRQQIFRLTDYNLSGYSKEAIDFIYKLLRYMSPTRISATKGLEHNWFGSIKTQAFCSPLLAKKLIKYQRNNNILTFIHSYLAFKSVGERDRQQIIQHFNAIDTNRNGQIELDQLKVYFQKQGINMTSQQLHQQLRKADTNKNQKLDLSEFVAVVMGVSSSFKQSLMELFQDLDRNGDGFIERKELSQVLKMCGGQEIDWFMRQIDENLDAKISWYQFYNFMEKQMQKIKSNKDIGQ